MLPKETNKQNDGNVNFILKRKNKTNKQKIV